MLPARHIVEEVHFVSVGLRPWQIGSLLHLWCAQPPDSILCLFSCIFTSSLGQEARALRGKVPFQFHSTQHSLTSRKDRAELASFLSWGFPGSHKGDRGPHKALSKCSPIEDGTLHHSAPTSGTPCSSFPTIMRECSICGIRYLQRAKCKAMCIVGYYYLCLKEYIISVEYLWMSVQETGHCSCLWGGYGLGSKEERERD